MAPSTIKLAKINRKTTHLDQSPPGINTTRAGKENPRAVLPTSPIKIFARPCQGKFQNRKPKQQPAGI